MTTEHAVAAEGKDDVSVCTSNNASVNNGIKLSHKQWRNLLRKQKRKIKRQEEAKKKELKEGDETKELSPESQRKQFIEEHEEFARQQREKAEKIYQHQLWLERERIAQEAWKNKLEREERENQKRLEIEQKIREEWEEQQKREKEEEEVKVKKAKQRKDQQVMDDIRDDLEDIAVKDFDALLLEATANENKDDGPWHNPIIKVVQGKERETCPFFMKTGTCRFGERCSRGHPYPESSTVLLFPGMYSHFELEQGLRDEYDTGLLNLITEIKRAHPNIADLILEYEDNELYHNFQEFYNDIVPEFKGVGKVIQIKVCCNYEPHLRGNVYVQYQREDDAMKAFTQFNGRYYGGRQLSCEFVTILKWKSAICGLFGRGRCPKGRNCNFLHVFMNPKNEFWGADQDNNQSEKYSNYRTDYRDRQNDRYTRNRSSSYRSRRSRSRSHSPKHRKRGRHRENYRHSYSRSRSRERSRRVRSKSRSRSRERSWRKRLKERRPRRDYSRSRSRSRDRKRSYSRSRSRERFRSRIYGKKSNSRSSSRSKSKSRSPARSRKQRSRSHSRDKLFSFESKDDEHSDKNKELVNKKNNSDSHNKTNTSEYECDISEYKGDDSEYKYADSEHKYANSEYKYDKETVGSDSDFSNSNLYKDKHNKHKKHKKHKHSRSRQEN